jgi:flagellar basal-body rod protein FlgB
MPFSIDKAFGPHLDAIALRARRAEILAGNLANADTPNFKARDLDFGTALREAGKAAGPAHMVRTHPRHLPAQSGGAADAELKYRIPEQPSIDGNTVDTHVEQAKFMDNAMRYQASLTFVSRRVQGLIAAMREE